MLWKWTKATYFRLKKLILLQKINNNKHKSIKSRDGKQELLQLMLPKNKNKLLWRVVLTNQKIIYKATQLRNKI